MGVEGQKNAEIQSGGTSFILIGGKGRPYWERPERSELVNHVVSGTKIFQADEIV